MTALPFVIGLIVSLLIWWHLVGKDEETRWW